MTGHTKFNEIRRDVPPEAAARARRNREQAVAAYELARLRRNQHRTQADVAAAMDVSQHRVSRIENGDLDRARLDTIRRYVGALGGTVRVVAEFPDNEPVTLA